MSIDWSQQHCGVRKANIATVRELMPDIAELLAWFYTCRSQRLASAERRQLFPTPQSGVSGRKQQPMLNAFSYQQVWQSTHAGSHTFQ
jgi:hypothetical protein